MSNAGFLIGFADFDSPLSLSEVADLLSTRVFGGIRFVEKDVDVEEYLGILNLEKDFLGMQVDLFGGNGGFTLELQTISTAGVSGETSIWDLSSIMKKRIETECKFVVIDLPLDQ